jgi:hypothetical protein
MLRSLSLALLLSGAAVMTSQAQSPTPGLIFKPATAGTPGAAVLDPNNDGYVSAAATGFTTVAGDLGAQSEIPYKYLPQRTTTEPNADLRVGPSNKFTDFADVTGGGSSVGFYVDGNNNYLFRFRLGGAAPNSKGYSIAIDTDNKFGFTGPNADPNAVAHNPGFEMEILLASNFGVRVYNIDGTTSPVGSGPDGSLIELPYASYAQKAIAGTTNDGNLDVFYDFYVPLATIQAAFGSQTFFNSTGNTAVPFSLTTSLRMVANTVIAPHSITHYQNISDIGGVNDTAYPNPDNAYTDLVTGSTPTTGGTVPSTSGNVIPARSAAPVVSSPLQTGVTSVGGTSTEAIGTTITVYVNGSALVTTTTVQIGGTWTLSGITALASGALVKATATAASKTESDFSNEVQAGGSTVCATAMPAAPGCTNDRGISGTATPGAKVYLRYLDGTLVPHNNGVTTGSFSTLIMNPVTADGSGAYLFTGKGGNSCSNGQSVLGGTYLISQAPGISCESAGRQLCITGSATAATPVVSTAKPITASTVSITGTATTGALMVLYVDGIRYSGVTATGGNYTFSTAGSTLPTLTAGRILNIYAAVKDVSCQSAAATLNVVAARTVVPPVVNSPLASGATAVSGTSSEAAGSTITLTRYATANATGAATVFSTTVQADGTWTVTGLAALALNNSFRATVTPADYGISAVSNVVNVQVRTASAPVITGTYAEKGTSVTGTSAAPVGSTITVYEDGDVIGSTTVQAGGTWTLSSLSDGSGVNPNTPYPALYAGGLLTATATSTAVGSLPSVASASVQVGCVTISNKTFTASPSIICQNEAASFTITNVEPGVVYTLQDATSGSNVTTGASRVGTGTGSSSLTIATSTFPAAGTYSIKLNAFSVGAVNCSQTTPTSFTVTVTAPPLDKGIGALSNSLDPGNTGTNITVPSSESSISYQLMKTSVTPNVAVGSPQIGDGSTLNLPTGAIAGTSTYGVAATRPSGCTILMAQRQTVNYFLSLPVELVGFEAAARNGNAVLTWRTASEKNNDHFEVERSQDGSRFSAVGVVAGLGTASQGQAYSFTDLGSARFGNQLYYRLRQVDTDGTISYSPVRTVSFAEVTSKPQLRLYPNPASTKASLSLALLPAGTYTVSVVSLTGQTLSTAQYAAGQAHELDLAQLPAGMYVVRVQNAALSLTQSLVKLN